MDLCWFDPLCLIVWFVVFILHTMVYNIDCIVYNESTFNTELTHCTDYSQSQYTTLHCNVLHCTELLHCTVLHCITPQCTAMFDTVVNNKSASNQYLQILTTVTTLLTHCTALHYTALHCTILHCTALLCTALSSLNCTAEN